MTVELLQTLSLAAFIAAGVLLLVSVALFFLLDVRKLYGDISGKTAKKAIEAIRQQNELDGNKAYKPHANANRERVTDKITHSGKIRPRKADNPDIGVGTEKFATETLMPRAAETTVLTPAASETTVLTSDGAANETTVLTSGGVTGETTVLASGAVVGETTVLANNSGAGETAKLTEQGANVEQGKREGSFTVDVEISFTGSTEIIE